ncbi:hypothetical protein P9112_010350 [Eukaryota sp. TZLM1-RC]
MLTWSFGKRSDSVCVFTRTSFSKRSRGVELCSEVHSTQRFLKTYSGRILSVDDIKLHLVVKQMLEDKIESDILIQPPIPTPRAGRPGVVRKRRSNEPRGPNSRSEKFTDAVEPGPKQRRKYTCKVCVHKLKLVHKLM